MNNGTGGIGGQGGVGQGGGVYVASGNLTMNSSLVSSNAFSGGDGGDGGTTVELGEPFGNIQGLNGKGGRGGSGGDLDGGGIYVGSGAVALDQLSIRSNALGGTGLARADGGVGGSAIRGAGGSGGNGGNVLGGGVFAAGASVTITDSSLIDNGFEATLPIGGNGGQGGVGATGQTNVFGNHRGAPGTGGNSQGGGLYSSSGGVSFIFNSTVAGNFAGAGGHSGSFSPTAAGDGSFNGHGQGGGIFVLTGTPEIHNDTILENQSLNEGGGIRYAGSGTLSTSTSFLLIGENNTIAGYNLGVTGSDVSLSAGTADATDNVIETAGGNGIADGSNGNTVGTSFLVAGNNVVYSTLTHDAATGTDYFPLLAATSVSGSSRDRHHPRARSRWRHNRTADQIGRRLATPPNVGSVAETFNPGVAGMAAAGGGGEASGWHALAPARTPR